MSEAENPGSGDIAEDPGDAYDANIEVIGDIHYPNTDLEGYKEHLTDKYDEGELDGILLTGDIAQNDAIRAGFDGDVEEYAEEFYDNLAQAVSILDGIGDELGVEIYTANGGNHAPIRGAQPGNEPVVETYEEVVQELDDDYDGEENLFDHLLEETDNVNNISGEVVEVGGTSILGGTHHFEGFKPEAPDDDFGYDFEDVADHLEDEFEPDYGIWGDLPVIGSVVETVGSWLGMDEKEFDAEELDYEDIPDELLEEGREEELEAFLEARGEYDQDVEQNKDLLEEAGEEAIVLTHGPVNGEEADSEIDLTEGRNGEKHIGSYRWKDAFQEYSDEMDITAVNGHLHSFNHEEELYGAEHFTVGMGEYMEAEIDGTVQTAKPYNAREWNGDVEPAQTGNEPSEEELQQLERAVNQVQQTDEFQEAWKIQEEKLEQKLEEEDEQFSDEDIEQIKENHRNRMAQKMLMSSPQAQANGPSGTTSA